MNLRNKNQIRQNGLISVNKTFYHKGLTKING
jgi:hypothetical protein